MLNDIPVTHFITLGVCLFGLGLFGALTRKNAIMILIGIELMISASVLNLVVFGAFDQSKNQGQTMALFAIVLAAAGVSVGLAIILNVYRHYKNINASEINQLKPLGQDDF